VREKYCWLVVDKPSEQGISPKGKNPIGFGFFKIHYQV
jgi:hypothetical protein